jgi:hypothetical protein
MSARTQVHIGLGASALCLLGCVALLFVRTLAGPIGAGNTENVRAPEPQNAVVNLVTVAKQ